MSRILITKLYDDLSAKLGKENAENLTTYIDDRIDTVMENKSKILATKEDISRLELSTKENFSRLELSTKEDFSKLERSIRADIFTLELSTKENISRLEQATKADFSRLERSTRADIFALELSTKENISRLEQATKSDFSRLEGKISETNIKIGEIKADLIQWMVGICIALVAMILGLYFKN